MCSVESCWAEIDNGKNKVAWLHGCIYKHPNHDLREFNAQLDDIIRKLNTRNNQNFIFGDMNIDFLKTSIHTQTEEYLDMLYSNNLLPIITKPTRITDHTATLVDHIYTNVPLSQILPGIATVDISDHLPVFCVSKMKLEVEDCRGFYRDYSSFKEEKFLEEITSTNWDQLLLPSKSLDEKTNDVIQTLKKVVDKHVPIKQASHSKRKQQRKPCGLQLPYSNL